MVSKYCTHLLDRASLNWGNRGRLRSTKVNRAFGMTSFLNLKTFSGTLFQQENGWQNLQVQKLRRVSTFNYRCKSRGRHLLLVSIVVLPLHLGLAPVAKVVVECFRGLLHLARKAYELASCFENWVITFTLRDPNLRILGFFSILLVLCFLLIWERWYENQIFDDITYLSMFGMCHCSY